MFETGALISALLRVAHLAQFDAGFEALFRAGERYPAVAKALETWPFVFHSLHVLANRETPFHRDVSSHPTWYDILLTLGSYERAQLVTRNLGMQVSYKPGTAVLLSSFVVHHGVAQVPPDRICYAFFMSRALHCNMGTPSEGDPAKSGKGTDTPWMTMDTYGSH